MEEGIFHLDMNWNASEAEAANKIAQRNTMVLFMLKFDFGDNVWNIFPLYGTVLVRLDYKILRSLKAQLKTVDSSMSTVMIKIDCEWTIYEKYFDKPFFVLSVKKIQYNKANRFLCLLL